MAVNDNVQQWKNATMHRKKEFTKKKRPRHSANEILGQREMPGGWFGFEATEGGQGRSMYAVRCADRFRWVSTPSGGSTRDRPQGRSILGKEVGMVIRVGARQTKAMTTSNYLRNAGRIRGG